MRTKLIVASIALLLIPTAASAITAEEIAAKVQSLLSQIASLQQELGLGSSTAGQTAQTTIDANSCPLVGVTLRPGSSGTEVSRLQRYLASEPSVYPEGTITGYYGSLTQSAVARWQAKNGIVTSGTPSTTGFGVFGPRTAAAIARQCALRAQAQTQTQTQTNLPQENLGGYMQISPATGAAPLRVSAVVTVNTPRSCSGAVYVLEWGDNTPVGYIDVPVNNCGLIAKTFTHTYQNPGVHTLKLSAGGHETTATVTVTGTGAGQSATSTLTSTNERISAAPLTGPAPLTVTFSGVVNTYDEGWRPGGNSYSTLEFGDGASTNIPLPAEEGSASSFSVTHTYVSAGTFKAGMYQGPKESAIAIVPGSPMTIVVGNGTGTGTGTGTSTPVQTALIDMTASAFSPNELTVQRGTVVYWRNTDSMSHTVTADNGSYNSGTIGPGGTYSLTLTQPGTYNYYCAFHGGPGGAGMSGKIIVQ